MLGKNQLLRTTAWRLGKTSFMCAENRYHEILFDSASVRIKDIKELKPNVTRRYISEGLNR